MSNPQHDLNEADLAQFTGSETFHKHPLFNIRFTEGVRYVAEHAGAWWLLEAIASWQLEPEVRDDPMLREIQFWTLTVQEDCSATLICERDVGDVAVTQTIEGTDFPLQSIQIYCQQGTLLLPSEY